MSNVIQFLESLGNKPTLSAGEYTASIAALGVDDAKKQALLDRDHNSLNNLLGGRAKVRFYISTPDGE